MRCEINAWDGLDVPLNRAGLIGELKWRGTLGLVWILYKAPKRRALQTIRMLLDRRAWQRVRCRLRSKQRYQSSRYGARSASLSESELAAQCNTRRQSGDCKPMRFKSETVRHSDLCLASAAAGSQSR